MLPDLVPGSYVVGSMCTGYGGLDAGVIEALGGSPTVAWVADLDKDCKTIIAHRMPGVVNLGDITTVEWEKVQPVDVLVAGFPCQPVSGAGKQKGMADARWIWPYIPQAIGRMAARPRLLVFENVPRLLTIDGGAAHDQVILSLAALGYVGRYGLYRASDAGSCHRRERWFLVAYDAHALGEGSQGSLPEGRHALGHGPACFASPPGPGGGGDEVPADADGGWRDPGADGRPGAPGSGPAGGGAEAAADPDGEPGVEWWRAAGVETGGWWPLGVGGGSGAGDRGRRVFASDAERARVRALLTGVLLGSARTAQGQGVQRQRVRADALDGGADDRPRRDDAQWLGAAAAHAERDRPQGSLGHDAHPGEAAQGVRPEPAAGGAGSAAAAYAADWGSPAWLTQPAPDARRRDADRAGDPVAPGPGPDGLADEEREAAEAALTEAFEASDDFDEWCPDEPGRIHTHSGYCCTVAAYLAAQVELFLDGDEPAPNEYEGQVDWAEYEPAIRRWELVSGRPAPCPVEPGKFGKPRLSALFAEWMMGLPRGWVTGVPGLSRSAQLKAIGNGVVPHQAALAVRDLFGSVEAGPPPATSRRRGKAPPEEVLLPTMHGVGNDAHGNELGMVARTLAGGGTTARTRAKHRGLREPLLPTPEASDATGGRVASELGGTRPSGAKRAVTLASLVAHKLTPPATE